MEDRYFKDHILGCPS